MKTLRKNWLALLGIFSGGLMLAQAADTSTTGAETKRPIHPTVDPILAAEFKAAEQQPTIPADALPPHSPGSFFSAQSPWLPPAPGNVIGVSLWSLGDNVYILNDVGIDYSALATVVKLEMVSEQNGGIHVNLSGQTAMPYLTVAAAGTNGLLVTVINNTNPINYEIWTSPVLISPNWTLATNGYTGQTNFLISINGPFPNNFFRAIWDIYGTPAWKMADPNNPSLGALAVFIDSPVNGAVLQ